MDLNQSSLLADESILRFEDDGLLNFSVLESMGIQLNKHHLYRSRIKSAIDCFNTTYLELMDFLTQILPLAKQKFGEPDNVLLPKTPSKKRRRYRKSWCEMDKENVYTSAENFESAEPFFKRTTRSSRNACQGEIQPASNTRSPKKQRSGCNTSNDTEKELCVTFNLNEPKVPVFDKSELLLSPTQKKSKRSLSCSPAVKQTRKRSKSSEGLLVAIGDSLLKPKSFSKDTAPAESLVGPMVQSGEEGLKSEHVIQADHNGNNVLVKSPETETRSVLKSDTTCDVLSCSLSAPGKGLTSVETQQNLKKRKSGDAQVDSTESSGPERVKKSKYVYEVESVLKNHDESCDEKCLSADIESTKPHSSNSNSELNHNKMQVEIILTEKTSDKRAESPHFIHGNVILSSQAQVRRSTHSSQRIRTSLLIQNKRRSSRLSKQRPGRRLSRRSSCCKKTQLLIQHVKQSSSGDGGVGEPFNPDSGSEQRILDQQKPASVSSGHSSIQSDEDLGAKVHCSKQKKLSSAPSGHCSTESEKESELKHSGSSLSKPVPPHASEKLSTESEEECEVINGPIAMSTPDINKPDPVKLPSRTSSRCDSSSDDNSEPSRGKVAGMIQQIDRNSRLLDQSRTPNGMKNLKLNRFNSSGFKKSASKPSNVLSGNIRSLIKHQAVKKPDADEIVRLKKLELQRKDVKERERKDQADERRKHWAEEQKRKREEKQKRVAATKAAREKEEKEKKQRQLEEKKQMLHALEQAKKKREQEEEHKKKLREQRKKEADARRLKEQEERLKRLHEKEEEDRAYRDMLKRKQEHDELERKQRIVEEKRLQEQKQRERQREQTEERQRKLREIKDREQKRVEKDDGETEKKTRDEVEHREKAEREKKQKEQEDREKKRIAQLIKLKMEQDKKLWEDKREKEERERKEREEQRKQRETTKLNRPSPVVASSSAAKAACVDCYQLTPPPAQTRKPSTDENYDISDLRSDESTDDEDCPRKKVPAWAQGAALKAALLNQVEPRQMFEAETGPPIVHAPDLDKIFQKKRKRFYYRTSSAHWDVPPLSDFKV